MAKCAPVSLALLPDEARSIICNLARKDVFARPLSGQSGQVPIIAERAGVEKILADVPQSIWTKLVTLGFVMPAGQKRDWCLSDIGRRCAKWCRSGKTARASRRQAKHAKSSPKALPVTGINAQESPLVWLSHRKSRDGKAMVNAQQLAAGERLRRDFTQANLSPNVTMNWSANAGIGSSRCHGVPDALTFSDAVAAARTRVSSALSAVGPELSGVLVDVCCHLNGLETAERQAGWPRRSGKVILLLALTALARHYGLQSSSSEDCARPVAVRHWGQEDYRPSIECSATTCDEA